MATATLAAPKKSKAKTAPKPVVLSGNVRRVADLFRQASEVTRLQILVLLTAGERNVGDICAQFGQSQPAVSHHLALLRHGRLVEPRRDGKHNFYGLTNEGRKLAELASELS